MFMSELFMSDIVLYLTIGWILGIIFTCAVMALHSIYQNTPTHDEEPWL